MSLTWASGFVRKTAPRLVQLQSQRYQHASLNDKAVETIKSIFGSNYTLAEATRLHHAKDESLHAEALPDAVVYPENVEQISKLLAFCNRNKIPVIPWGAGSGFEGGVNAVKGGVTVDVSKHMTNVLAVNVDDFDCWVEAGVTRKQLNNHIKDTGYWFPIDPGADACLGGMCATSASGTNAVRYGTMRENVLNLEVVTADGTVMHTAGKDVRSRKNVAGYNLTNLFVGSEGTLGVITKASLKIYPQPEAIISAVSPFPDVKAAVNATVEIMQTGLPIARIEFLDENSMKANNKYNKMNLSETPTLFLEFHGSNETVDSQAKVAKEVCESNSCLKFDWSTDLEERNKLWHARHNSWFAFKAIYPNQKSISTDVCVPISKLPEILVETKKDIETYGLKTTIVGHVGDGNFHTFISLDTNNEQEMKNYYEYTKKLVKHSLSLNGTCTGEHGIGLGKKKFMLDQFGPDALAMMKLIKGTLDPNAILNPDKVI